MKKKIKKTYNLNFFQESNNIIIATGLFILSFCSLLLMFKVDPLAIEELTTFAYFFLSAGLLIQLFDFTLNPAEWSSNPPLSIYQKKKNKEGKKGGLKNNIFPVALMVLLLIIIMGTSKIAREIRQERELLAQTRYSPKDLSIALKNLGSDSDLSKKITEKLNKEGFSNITYPPENSRYLFSRPYIFYSPSHREEAKKVYETLEKLLELEEIVIEEDYRLINEIEIIPGKNSKLKSIKADEYQIVY